MQPGPYKKLGSVLLVIATATAVLSLPIILFGLPNGHSLVLNVVWSQEFARQVLGGDLYPRWLTGMNGGAGSPAFYFYGPFPFYISTFAAAGCPACTGSGVVAITQSLILGASGLAMYFFMRQDFTAPVATVSAIVYMLMPYHLDIDLWQRQAFAEFTTYLWIPLVLIYARRAVEHRRAGTGLAMTYAGLVYTHLPVALLFSPYLMAYVLLYAPRANLWRALGRFFAFLAIGLLLAAPYLGPALVTQNLISADRWWTPYYDYSAWFFLDGQPEPNASFGSQLLVLLALSTSAGLIFSVLALIGRSTTERSSNALVYAAISIVVTWILMTPIGRPIWKYLPLLQKVQFPWRAAVMIDLATATLAGMAASSLLESDKDLKKVIIFALGLMLLAANYMIAPRSRSLLFDQFRPATLTEVKERAITYRQGTGEYLPRWIPTGTLANQSDLAEMQKGPLVTFDETSGTAQVAWDGVTDLTATTKFKKETTVTIHQFYYPAWLVELKDGSRLATGPSEELGLLQFKVPAGMQTVRISLAALPSEKVGQMLAALALAILLFLHWRSRTAAITQEGSLRDNQDPHRQ